MNKDAIRKEMLARREAIRAGEYAEYSRRINEKLLSLNRVDSAKCILGYYPHRNEPDIKGFLERIMTMGICASLPYVKSEGEMIAVRYTPDCIMQKNRYGIYEPGAEDEVIPDIVVVPGIAFDESMRRIGFGKGYYDRFLSNIKAIKIGVCFECQLTESITAEEHDIHMDLIVTEKRIIS